MSRKPAVYTENEVFPSRLRMLMSETSTTQQALADVIGIKRQTVSLYMSGQSKPNTEQIVGIARHFKVLSDWLLGLTDNRAAENIEVGKEFGLTDEAINTIRDFHKSKMLFKSSEKADDMNEPNIYEIDVLNHMLRDGLGKSLYSAPKNYIDMAQTTSTRIYITKEGKCFTDAQEMVDSLNDGFVPFTVIRSDNAIRDHLISEIKSN